ncbi:MAG: tetratricopeptide repeat protein [Acidobacteria bacterium]|nr:tetratricopeptide repeat protein [Acidobacteriota bacterium]
MISTFALTLALAGCASGPDTTTAQGQMTIGSRAARQGLWREAMFRYRKAVQIEPANAMALSNLGVAYESEGDFENAREAYLKALQSDRANPYIQKNYSRFSEFYQKYKKREPKVLDGEQGTEQAPATETPKPPAVPEEKKP